MSNMERGKNDPREEGGYARDPFLRTICLFCGVVRLERGDCMKLTIIFLSFTPHGNLLYNLLLDYFKLSKKHYIGISEKYHNTL